MTPMDRSSHDLIEPAAVSDEEPAPFATDGFSGVRLRPARRVSPARAGSFELTMDLIEPGMVLVLGDDGQLTPSQRAYQTRPIGVVGRVGQIISSGPADCWVVVIDAPVRVGDWLTTAHVLGHAMRLNEPAREAARPFAKALAPLAQGRARIRILLGG